MNPLTRRQEEVLNLINHEILTRGRAPTIRELREALKLHSLRGVTIHLEALSKKGYLKRDSQARGIQILKLPKKFSLPSKIKVPLIGQVQAGLPIFAEQNIEKYISIKKELLKGATKAYLLRVRGDSMKEVNINDGDIVIVSAQEVAQDGDIVVALLQDEVTLKRFQRVGDYIALLPANPKYEPIIGRQFEIQGKMIGKLSLKQIQSSKSSKRVLLPMRKNGPRYTDRWAFGTMGE